MSAFRSKLAQCTFDATITLHSLSAHSGLLGRSLARAALKAVLPILRVVGNDQAVVATVYGQSLAMPARHPLPATMALFPQYNRPFGLAAEAIVHSSTSNAHLAVIDVGANIGDTIAILEQSCPARWHYLCIEPDPAIAEFCTANHADNDRVQVRQIFIGEDEGADVWLQDDGRANPSTKRQDIMDSQSQQRDGKLVRLDTASNCFATSYGTDLIKVDTEGYDFHVLRSGQNLLRTYQPALYFELFPKLLLEAMDSVEAGFNYLAGLGYRYFVFFTNRGDLYCTVTDPDHIFLRGLENIAGGTSPLLPYFDVFASVHKNVCDTLVEMNIDRAAK
ncbi:FkbM family methyltransferase [Granulicella sp. L46]|uniref:FkbM family methyltransferase n=1 Tax=Granulicella sp. L46 TaxID=1641865 RepID=UPI00131D7452|nr:FkbM family methyltransferase [Granulicella sp. L46]